MTIRRLFVRPKAGQPPWPSTAAGWAAHLLMLAFYMGTVAVGALGFYKPSITLSRELDTAWLIYIWSATFVLFGAVCWVARYLQEWRLEAVALIPQALALGLWGFAVFFGSENATQIGFRLVVGSLLPLALVCFAFDWTTGQRKQAEAKQSEALMEKTLRRASEGMEQQIRARRDDLGD